MKEGWKYSQLGSICKIYNGNSVNADYKKNHYTNLHDGYPFIATKDVSFDGYISYNNGVNIPYDEGFKVAKPGSVFICAEGGSAGKKIGYVEREVCFGNKLFCLEPLNILIGTYLYYFLRSNIFQNQFAERLTGLIGGVSAKKFSDITVFFPSIHEQQRIVEYLDSTFAEIDALKAKAAEEVANAKAMFDAALREEMTPKEGWEEKTVGQTCQLKSGNSSANNSSIGELPFVKVGDLNLAENKEGIVTSSRFVNREENSKAIFPRGTTIFPKRGGAILTNKKRLTKVEICCDLNIMGVIPGDNMLPEYLYYFFLNTDLRELYDGASIPQINNCNIAPLTIFYPPLSTQQRIVARLDTLRTLVNSLEQKYAKIATECDALKQAILRETFE